MKQIFAEAYIHDLSVYRVNASNRPPTFCYAALPINIQEVSVCTRAVQSPSSLRFITEMVTASVLQQAGVGDGQVL